MRVTRVVLIQMMRINSNDLNLHCSYYYYYYYYYFETRIVKNNKIDKLSLQPIQSSILYYKNTTKSHRYLTKYNYRDIVALFLFKLIFFIHTCSNKSLNYSCSNPSYYTFKTNYFTL